jgi:ABC-2 type transport system ATP-binding protein
MTVETIIVKDLVKKYGELTAVNGITFSVKQGEIFGLLGPNGAGKTTTLMMLSSLLPPTAGSASVNGYDVRTQAPHVRESIGMVFQDPSSDPVLTAYENLKLHALLYDVPLNMIDRKIDEVLSLVDLDKRKNDIVKTFSGGMQRRVELAKGLMHRPNVLLLDEPTTGLDPGARRDLWLYLSELREQEKVSIIVTTHLMEEAERCDRLAILNLGEIVGLGTPAELRSEIGGDVVMLEATDPAALAQRIQERFKIATTVLDSRVRLEIKDGLKFVTTVAEAFPGAIQSVSISKPTLDDVFISRTGHRFWTEQEQQEVD